MRGQQYFLVHNNVNFSKLEGITRIAHSLLPRGKMSNRQSALVHASDQSVHGNCCGGWTQQNHKPHNGRNKRLCTLHAESMLFYLSSPFINDSKFVCIRRDTLTFLSSYSHVHICAMRRSYRSVLSIRFVTENVTFWPDWLVRGAVVLDG